MEEYDQFTWAHLPEELPRPASKDHRRLRGDSIYGFSVTPPLMRSGVHTEENRRTNLAGEYVLLSNFFLEVVEAFIEWIDGLGYPLGILQLW